MLEKLNSLILEAQAALKKFDREKKEDRQSHDELSRLVMRLEQAKVQLEIHTKRLAAEAEKAATAK